MAIEEQRRREHFLDLHNDDVLWANMIWAHTDLLMVDRKEMTDNVLYDFLKMGILDWESKPKCTRTVCRKYSQVAHSECPDDFIHDVPFSAKFWATLGTLQGHSKCPEFSSFLDVSLQCPQSFPKNYQKWYIVDEIVRTF